MIQIYTDDTLAYDSRLEEYDLLGLQVTTGVNKGGNAAIVMPPQHPAYSRFVSFKTIITIYRDDTLVFRGRPLYPTDDFLNRRTITCEGERCFLRDAVSRAYIYQDTPANIFTAVIAVYNEQVESAKQFVVGTLTVTDPNDYVRMESEFAEQVSATIDKLVERCGGYIVFTTNGDGDRVINWYASLSYQSTQTIEFGENLLEFTRSANTDLATRIIPYGAKDDETGTRLTIESVNSGLDYVEDADAVALRGVIAKPVYWDDVTVAANLLTKAQTYLTNSKLIITSLTVSAVDLTLAGQSIDNFRVGDSIHVISPPHGVNAWMLLQDLTEDLLRPENSRISLGGNSSTLTGADVAGDRESRGELQQTRHDIKSDYTRDVAAAVQDATTVLISMIQQTSESIQTIVAETYATSDELQSAISTQITQLSDSITLHFTQLQAIVDDNDVEARTQFQTIQQYIRFEEGNIILGETGNELTAKIENDRISFLSDGVAVAYFSNRRLYVTDGEFLHSLQLGKFAFRPRENDNLSFNKVVD